MFQRSSWLMGRRYPTWVSNERNSCDSQRRRSARKAGERTYSLCGACTEEMTTRNKRVKHKERESEPVDTKLI